MHQAVHTYEARIEGRTMLMELQESDLTRASQEACQWALQQGLELSHLRNLTTGEAAAICCNAPGSPLKPAGEPPA